MTQFLLIRHAEAEGNVYRRSQGHFDSLVTPRGLRQIELLSARLKNEQIDAVYSSDLYRARRTAAAVYVPRNLTLTTDKRFREIYMSTWEDVPFGEVIKYEPEQVNNLDRDPWHWFAGDSEPFADVQARFMSALTELAEKHDNQTVAIVSHGMAIRGATCAILGVTGADRYREVPASDNTSVARVTFDGKRFSVAATADASHLPDELSTRMRQRAITARFGGIETWNLRYIQTGDSAFDALFGDEVAGRVEFTVNGSVGVITKLELLPKYRGAGLGVQLIGQVVSAHRRAGGTRLRPEIPPELAETAGFFAHHGFLQDADTQNLELNISIDHDNAL